MLSNNLAIGGAGDNMLIAGTTDYDTNVTALNALMAEWTRTGANSDFATRVQNLMNGVGPGGQYKLTAQTVHRASAPNTLVGGGGQNLFFLTLGVDLFSRLAGSQGGVRSQRRSRPPVAVERQSGNQRGSGLSTARPALGG